MCSSIFVHASPPNEQKFQSRDEYVSPIVAPVLCYIQTPFILVMQFYPRDLGSVNFYFLMYTCTRSCIINIYRYISKHKKLTGPRARGSTYTYLNPCNLFDNTCAALRKMIAQP